MTVKEYFEQEEVSYINEVIRYSKEYKKPVDCYGIGDLYDFSFDDVNELKDKFNKGFSVSDYCDFLTKRSIEYQNTDIEMFLKSFNYLIEQIENINNAELLTLGSDGVSDDQINAGIDELNKLGSYLQKRTIAEKFGQRPADVGKWSYYECYLELLTQKRLNDYERRMIEINKIKHAK